MRAMLVALALLAAGSAAAEEIYLPPAAFAPAASGVLYSLDQGGLGCLRLYKGSGFFIATVPMAPGTAVDEVTVLLEDTNADAYGLVSLVRRRETSFDAIAVSKASLGGGAVEALSVAIEPPAVARPRQTLLLQVLLTGPDVCLHGARVRIGP